MCLMFFDISGITEAKWSTDEKIGILFELICFYGIIYIRIKYLPELFGEESYPQLNTV